MGIELALKKGKVEKTRVGDRGGGAKRPKTKTMADLSLGSPRTSQKPLGDKGEKPTRFCRFSNGVPITALYDNQNDWSGFYLCVVFIY